MSLQSCPTLCDPIDGSPPGSPVPGILQARTLAWVAISFSNAWKWKVKVKLLSRVWLRDPMDCSLPGSSIHGIFQARVLEWFAVAFSAHYSILLWKFQFYRVSNGGFISSGYTADPQGNWWAQWLDSGHLTQKPELDTVSRAHRWGWQYFMIRTSRGNWDQLVCLILRSPFYWRFYSNPLSQCLCFQNSKSTSIAVTKLSTRCFTHVWLNATPRTVARQAPLSMGFPRQEYWSGLPFSSGDLPDPGIEPRSLILQADSLPSELPGKQCVSVYSKEMTWMHESLE